jgi:hypothetical protein
VLTGVHPIALREYYAINEFGPYLI